MFWGTTYYFTAQNNIHKRGGPQIRKTFSMVLETNYGGAPCWHAREEETISTCLKAAADFPQRIGG